MEMATEGAAAHAKVKRQWLRHRVEGARLSPFVRALRRRRRHGGSDADASH